MFIVCFQGRHTKTGQLAAIKVMNVTEVGHGHIRSQKGHTDEKLNYSPPLPLVLLPSHLPSPTSSLYLLFLFKTPLLHFSHIVDLLRSLPQPKQN